MKKLIILFALSTFAVIGSCSKTFQLPKYWEVSQTHIAGTTNT